MIRVAIAEDHPEMRVVLRLLIRLSVDMELIWEAVNGQEALDYVQRLPPDVLVMDIQMPLLDGWMATKKIVAMGLQTQVILISGHIGSYIATKSAEVGARGFILKDDLAELLPQAIKAVVHGEMFFRKP
jgi:DNA-binding NarL/FixJ family response regulator